MDVKEVTLGEYAKIVKETRKNECILVAIDFDNGGENPDSDVLVVGRQKRGVMDVLNLFQGPEARELYEKLITPREEKEKI